MKKALVYLFSCVVVSFSIVACNAGSNNNSTKTINLTASMNSCSLSLNNVVVLTGTTIPAESGIALSRNYSNGYAKATLSTGYKTNAQGVQISNPNCHTIASSVGGVAAAGVYTIYESAVGYSNSNIVSILVTP